MNLILPQLSGVMNSTFKTMVNQRIGATGTLQGNVMRASSVRKSIQLGRIFRVPSSAVAGILITTSDKRKVITVSVLFSHREFDLRIVFC